VCVGGGAEKKKIKIEIKKIGRKEERKKGRNEARKIRRKEGSKEDGRKERKKIANQALNAQKCPRHLTQDIWVSGLLYTASHKRTSMHEC